MSDALDKVDDSDAFSPEFSELLCFATKLTDKPQDVRQCDVDGLLKVGWSEQAIEDAINVVALFNYVNRNVDALGIEGTEPYFKRFGASLATKGYTPLIEVAAQRAS